MRFYFQRILFTTLFSGIVLAYGQDCTCKIQGADRPKNAVLLSSAKEFQLLKPLTGLCSPVNRDSTLKNILFLATKQGDSSVGIKWSGHIYSPDKIELKYKDGLLIDITPCTKGNGQFYELPVKLNINKARKHEAARQAKTAWERFDYAVKVTELSWKNMLLRLAEVAPEKHPVSKFFSYLNKKYKCGIPRADKAGLRPDEYLDSAVACLLRAKVDLIKEVYEQYLKKFANADGSFNPVFEKAYFCLTRQADHGQEKNAANAAYDFRLKDENVSVAFAPGLLTHETPYIKGVQTELKFLDVKVLKWNEITGLQLDNNNKVCFPPSTIGHTGITIDFHVAYPDLSILNDEFWRIYKGQHLDGININESQAETDAFTGVYVPEAYMSLPFSGKAIKVNAKQVLIGYNSIQGFINIQAERTDSKKIKLLFKDTSVITSVKEIQKELKQAGLHADVFLDDPLGTGYFSKVIIRFDYKLNEY